MLESRFLCDMAMKHLLQVGNKQIRLNELAPNNKQHSVWKDRNRLTCVTLKVNKPQQTNICIIQQVQIIVRRTQERTGGSNMYNTSTVSLTYFTGYL